MTFIIPTSSQAKAGLRAMKSVVTATGPLDEARRAVLNAVQAHLLRTAHDLDALEPITPQELAAAVTPPRLREQLVNAMATLALAGPHVDGREVAAIEPYATALGAHPNALEQVRRLSEERLFLLRVDAIRRGPSGNAITQLYEEHGALGVAKNIASFTGLWENLELSARYHALARYSEGSLGRELYDFYRKNAFAFPGEKRGAPESLLPHDLSHILAGYGTDMPGEALTLSFQAGYRREDPFGILVFLLLIGQHGIALTPLAKPTLHILDEPGLAEGMVRAFARGARANTDFTAGWDFWAVMDQPLAALRERYGIQA